MTRKPESAQPVKCMPILGEDEFKGVYKRPPRERSHLCDVFCRLLDAFSQMKEARMFKPATAAVVLVALSAPVYAAGDFPMATMQTTLPREAVTVTDWYKQNVYDPNENKIGDIKFRP